MRQINIRFFGHLGGAEFGQVMLGGLYGLMSQGLADNLDGLVLIFQRHGEAVAGSIYCDVLLALRECLLLGTLFQGGIETLAHLHQIVVQLLIGHLQADDRQHIVPV